MSESSLCSERSQPQLEEIFCSDLDDLRVVNCAIQIMATNAISRGKDSVSAMDVADLVRPISVSAPISSSFNSVKAGINPEDPARESDEELKDAR